MDPVLLRTRGLGALPCSRLILTSSILTPAFVPGLLLSLAPDLFVLACPLGEEGAGLGQQKASLFRDGLHNPMMSYGLWFLPEALPPSFHTSLATKQLGDCDGSFYVST